MIENKINYIKNNIKQKFDIKLMELSYDTKTAPNIGVDGDKWNYDVYRSDPAEKDAWKIGDSIENSLYTKGKNK